MFIIPTFSKVLIDFIKFKKSLNFKFFFVKILTIVYLTALQGQNYLQMLTFAYAAKFAYIFSELHQGAAKLASLLFTKEWQACFKICTRYKAVAKLSENEMTKLRDQQKRLGDICKRRQP